MGTLPFHGRVLILVHLQGRHLMSHFCSLLQIRLNCRFLIIINKLFIFILTVALCSVGDSIYSSMTIQTSFILEQRLGPHTVILNMKWIVRKIHGRCLMVEIKMNFFELNNGKFINLLMLSLSGPIEWWFIDQFIILIFHIICFQNSDK